MCAGAGQASVLFLELGHFHDSGKAQNVGVQKSVQASVRPSLALVYLSFSLFILLFLTTVADTTFSAKVLKSNSSHC